jgi:hypothetical protein
MNNRMVRSSRRNAKAHYKRWNARNPPATQISPNETRAELVNRAREIIERIRSRANGSPHPFSRWEVRDMLAEVGTLRAAALNRPPAPSGPNIAWYVSARDGERFALLYGPLRTQGAALRALRTVRHFVQERNYCNAAFAAFGTTTFTGDSPPVGSLNDALADTLRPAA